jgi:hypothetical protein
MILLAIATVAYLQRDKAQQLAMQQERLDEARASVSAERTSNATLTGSLNKRQLDLDHTQANLLGELSGAKRLIGELDSALGFASHGARIDLALPADAVKASPAAAALASLRAQCQIAPLVGRSLRSWRSGGRLVSSTTIGAHLRLPDLRNGGSAGQTMIPPRPLDYGLNDRRDQECPRHPMLGAVPKRRLPPVTCRTLECAFQGIGV